MTVFTMWKRLKSAIAVFVFEQLDFIFLCVSAIHARPTICKDYVMSCLSYLSHWFIMFVNQTQVQANLKNLLL